MPSGSPNSWRGDLDMLADKITKGHMIVDHYDKRSGHLPGCLERTFRILEIPNSIQIQGPGEIEFLKLVSMVLNHAPNTHVRLVDIDIEYPVVSSLGGKLSGFKPKGYMRAEVEFVEVLSSAHGLGWSRLYPSYPNNAQAILALRNLLGAESVDTPVKDLGLSIEPIVGFRDWNLRRFRDGIYLISRNQEPWPHREKLVGQCGSVVVSHDVPEITCQCGIYAFNKTVEGQKMWFKSSGEVGVEAFGTVNLWGEVLIGPMGFRAEFAYPKEVFLRDNGTRRVRFVADELTEAYGIPVTVVGDPLTASMGDTLEELKGGESQ